MIEQLMEELEQDEGRVNSIYVCTAGKPTFGVGHMITPSDPEYGQPEGTPVSEERVASVFMDDVANTLEDCRRLYPNFDNIPQEAQLILGNMMFNLGYPRLKGFRRLKVAIGQEQWENAAAEMADSAWHRQLPRRSGRLIDRMSRLS